LPAVTTDSTVPRLAFRQPLDPARLLRSRHRIRDYLHEQCVEEETIDDIVLAIEEAMTNAVRHSGALDDLEVDLRFEGRDLIAEVRDHGRGFEVATFDPKHVPESLASGGRGLFLISELMDEVKLRRDGGLEVRTIKRGAREQPARRRHSRQPWVVPSDQTYEGSRRLALLEEIDEGFVALDWEYRQVYANTAACRLVGLPCEQLLGRTPFELWPTLARTAWGTAIREAMELGKPAIIEYETEAGDWRELRIYPTSAGLSAYFRDITERKRKEREREELFMALRASRRGLERAQEMAHLGSWELDLLSDHLSWSDEVYRIFGLKPREFGATYEAFLERVHPDDRDAVDAAYSGSLRENRDDYEIEHRVVRKNTGEIRVVLERCHHIRDEAGKIVRSEGMAHDITERVRAEEALRANELRLRRHYDEAAVRERFSTALNGIVASITSLLDYDEILDVVVAKLGMALGAESATMCSLDGASWVPRHLWNVPTEVLDVPIPREQVAYANGAVEEKCAVAIDDCETDPRVDVALQHAWGVRSVMTVPLIVRGEVVGSLFFNYHSTPHTFSDLEIDFAERATGVIAGVLETARLFEEQQRIATTLQENFLHPLPLVEGLELGVVSQTAFAPELVGGDFSDVFLLGDGQVAILIGDVAGKGVRAAGLTETVRSTVRAFAAIDTSPAFILRKTNEALLAYDPDEPHVTAFLGVLDPRSGHLSFAGAGHPAPVHVGPYSCRVLDVPHGPPLGTFPSEYITSHVMLSLEDYLILYTDGVIEARRGDELFGEGQLLEVTAGMKGRSAQELADGVLEAVAAFADRLKDDLQIVTLRLA
jgi:PAS domain S-box-containing protein